MVSERGQSREPTYYTIPFICKSRTGKPIERVISWLLRLGGCGNTLVIVTGVPWLVEASPHPCLDPRMAFPVCVSVPKLPLLIRRQSHGIRDPLYSSVTPFYLVTAAKTRFPNWPHVQVLGVRTSAYLLGKHDSTHNRALRKCFLLLPLCPSRTPSEALNTVTPSSKSRSQSIEP